MRDLEALGGPEAGVLAGTLLLGIASEVETASMRTSRAKTRAALAACSLAVSCIAGAAFGLSQAALVANAFASAWTAIALSELWKSARTLAAAVSALESVEGALSDLVDGGMKASIPRLKEAMAVR